MRRLRRVSAAAFAVAFALGLAGCGGGGSAEAGTPTSRTPVTSGTESAPPGRGDADLVIWTDERQADVVRGLAQDYGARSDLRVAVHTVPDDHLGTLLTANAAGNGPDVFVGPHDWIGTLVQNGAIEPVRLTETDQQRYSPVALAGVTYKGSVYGVPYAYESVALFRNTDLVPSAPATVEDLAAAARQARAENALCLPVGRDELAYYLHPLYSSAGGYLLGQAADGGYSPTDLGIGKLGSLQAARALGALGAQGVLKTSITQDGAVPLFTAGRCAFLEAGPSAVAEVKRAGTPYALTPMVGFAGMGPARALTTVDVFFVASKGQGRDDGQRFVLDAVNSPAAMRALYGAEPRPPAMTQVLAGVAQTDPDAATFAAAAASGQLVPAVPQMSSIWEPLSRAEAAIIDGADPTTTMTLAGADIADQLS